MRARIAATVVLAAGILIGTTGCGLIAPQATQLQYDPSDGIGADVGEVDIRNALLITDEEGANATLVASLVNRGDEPHRVSVQYEGNAGKVTEEVTVPAKSSIVLGGDDGPTLTLREVDAQPGSLFPVFFQYGEETGAEMLVPVLTDALDEYSTLGPTPTPTPLLEPATEPTQTPEPTETPAP
ncbi:MAG TPA: hypothetical protein VEX88_05235 [Glaciibacter sp.]|nr:hypothetical protein [Glaciibacter sp.]